MASLLPKVSQVFGKAKGVRAAPAKTLAGNIGWGGIQQTAFGPSAGGQLVGPGYVAPQASAGGGGVVSPAPTPRAAPATAAAPVVTTPTPPAPDAGWQDSTYNATVGNINRGLTNLQDYLTQSGKTLGSNYGINYSGDLTGGTAGGFSIDPNVDVSNPFSKAALLKRSYDQGIRGNTNTYAGQGQLYSGALQNAQNQSGFANQQGQDALLKDFGGQFSGLYQQWLQAQNQATQEGIDAQLAARLRHENDPATATTTGGSSGGGSSTPVSAPGSNQPFQPVTVPNNPTVANQQATTASQVAIAAAQTGKPLTPQGTPAPPPPPTIQLRPGMLYLPADGKSPAQFVNADGTVRPATAADYIAARGAPTPAPVARTSAPPPVAASAPVARTGPPVVDQVTGRVYTPAKGVAVAPGWKIVNGKLVRG